MLKLRWVKEKFIICNKKIDQGVTLEDNEATSFEIFPESSNWTLNKLNCNWLFILLLGYWILTAEFGFLQVIFYKKTSCTQTEHTRDNFQDNFFFNGFAEAFWILYLFFSYPIFLVQNLRWLQCCGTKKVVWKAENWVFVNSCFYWLEISTSWYYWSMFGLLTF